MDSDIELANSEAKGWAKHGIEMERVDNMSEAIQNLLYKKYLYVGINGDSIDFMPALKIMRSATNSPILIATSNFTAELEAAALNNGADLYARWHENTAGNITSILAHITRMARIRQLNNELPAPLEVMSYNGLLILPAQRCALIGDKRLDLTRQEYTLLYTLMVHYGDVLTYGQIYRYVWNGEYSEGANRIIKDVVIRLRKKLVNCTNLIEYVGAN